MEEILNNQVDRMTWSFDTSHYLLWAPQCRYNGHMSGVVTVEGQSATLAQREALPSLRLI